MKAATTPAPRFVVKPAAPVLAIEHVREIRRRFLTPPRPTIAMLAHDYEQPVAVIRDILPRPSHYDLEDDLVPLVAVDQPGRP